jgi:hypothetical protein
VHGYLSQGRKSFLAFADDIFIPHLSGSLV